MILGAFAGLGLAGTSAAVLAATGRLSRAVPAAIDAAPDFRAGPRLTTPSADDLREWSLFKAQAMSPDGRIIDTGNHNESHSEGQGVGLLFAVAFDDQEAFDRLLAWTRVHLRRGDGLHAWRYLPNAPVAVPDVNNATDGDIYIAAALQRAARRWNNPDYAAEATVCAGAIHDLLIMPVGRRVVLLPGQSGFVHRDRVSINLSYYVFPLFGELAAAFPSPSWARVRRDGVALIEAARFGVWGLPPDWLDINATNDAISLAEAFPPRFSWDAVRVPLFLAWAGEGLGVVAAAQRFWQQQKLHPPAWVDLKSGVTADYAAPLGVQAINSIAETTLSGGIHEVRLPTVTDDTYYSAALTLLSRMALKERTASASDAQNKDFHNNVAIR